MKIRKEQSNCIKAKIYERQNLRYELTKKTK
jgi:hypothetical protein